MYEAVEAFLRERVAERGMSARFLFDQALMEGRWLRLLVYVEGDQYDAYDRASLLQDLEDAWNDQEPQPEPRLWLIPAGRGKRAETTAPPVSAGPR